MSDNALKKEFKHSDVQRIRNIVNKDFTSKTKSQTGYKRSHSRHEEGDIWEEGGKTWTIKDGIRQNVTKLDAAKKAVKVPFACPKCQKSINSDLSKQVYKVNKMCLDCFVAFEAELQRSGLYDSYVKQIRKGNILHFAKELEQWLAEAVEYDNTYVTEHGDIEDWKSNESAAKLKLTNELTEYIEYLKSKVE